MKKLDIGVLISETGSNMKAIVKACEKGEISGEVVFVGSDNPEAKGLVWAKGKGIPTFAVDYKKIKKELSDVEVPHAKMIHSALKKTLFLREKFPGDMKKKLKYLHWKITAEHKLLMRISNRKLDLLILAGFMQNLTSHFIDAVNTKPDKPRIMNIHPALLPSFRGENGYEDTFSYGCKVGGCTVHFVDYGEDTGPIIGQESFPIYPSDNLEDVKKKGLNLEWQLYPRCIQLFAENRLKVVASASGRKIVKIKER
jgi:phosphoribosylglycinamide formyltransferase-1